MDTNRGTSNERATSPSSGWALFDCWTAVASAGASCSESKACPSSTGRDGWCPNVLEWFDPDLIVCESYAVAFPGVGGVAGGGAAECAAPFDYEALGVDVVGLNCAAFAVDCAPIPLCPERDEQCWTFEFGDAPAITVEEALCTRIRDGEFDRLDFVPPWACGIGSEAVPPRRGDLALANLHAAIAGSDSGRVSPEAPTLLPSRTSRTVAFDSPAPQVPSCAWAFHCRSRAPGPVA